jgi:NAD(P)-dependent dehydrogenase (short-subunit alcohol dehydrogenase family)/uncharacterized protein YndB with AHSA1/START domain
MQQERRVSIRWPKVTGIRPLSPFARHYRDPVSNNSEKCLTGETALIAGGGRGIGLAIATELARVGASVALVARSADELSAARRAVERVGGSVVAHRADVTDETAMADVIESVRGTLGPVTILVNNAGAIGPIAPFGESALDQWWRCVEVNLRGPAVCAHLVVHDMIARGRGRIINLVSGAGTASFTYFSAYVASKTAVVRWTESVAAELAPYGVKVFAMEPGTVVSAMSNFSVNSPEGRRWIPWFKGIFDAGLDSPMARIAERALDLAKGNADELSGRYIPLTESLEELVASAPLIRQNTLYSLRIARLPQPAERSAALRAVRALSEAASPSVIRLRRRLPVSVEEGFGLWRDGETVASWFLPLAEAEWTERPTMELRGGGKFDLRMSVRGERYHIYGEVITASPDEGITLDWNWDSSAPTLRSGSGTTVRVEFISRRGGVDVVINHDALPDEIVRDAYVRGWRRCLEGMDRVVDLVLQRREPGHAPDAGLANSGETQRMT